MPSGKDGPSPESVSETLRTMLGSFFSSTAELTHPEFSFHSLHSEAFARLRAVFDISDDLLRASLLTAGPLTGGISRGKSGAYLFFTADKQFVIKAITASEEQLFFRKTMFEDYCEYCKNFSHTLLPRILGFYKLTWNNSVVYRFMMMTSVFASVNRKIHERYDMKGSQLNRKAEEDELARSDTIYKDMDFLDKGRTIRLDKTLKLTFQLQLAQDVKFLKNHFVMDYSLLVGIHFFDEKDTSKPSPGHTKTDSPKSSKTPTPLMPAVSGVSILPKPGIFFGKSPPVPSKHDSVKDSDSESEPSTKAKAGGISAPSIGPKGGISVFPKREEDDGSHTPSKLTPGAKSRKSLFPRSPDAPEYQSKSGEMIIPKKSKTPAAGDSVHHSKVGDLALAKKGRALDSSEESKSSEHSVSKRAIEGGISIFPRDYHPREGVSPFAKVAPLEPKEELEHIVVPDAAVTTPVEVSPIHPAFVPVASRKSLLPGEEDLLQAETMSRDPVKLLSKRPSFVPLPSDKTMLLADMERPLTSDESTPIDGSRMTRINPGDDDFQHFMRLKQEDLVPRPSVSVRPVVMPDLEELKSDPLGFQSIFQQVGGGMLSRDRKELYFIGLIDVLQAYDARKKMETAVKTIIVKGDTSKVSSVSPKQYADRFIKFVSNILK